MLLAIDVGNTHIVLGLYDGEELRANWRLRSDIEGTVDEYGTSILSLLTINGFGKDTVTGIIVSCVVPPLTRVFNKLSLTYFSVEPMIVGPGLKTGIHIACDDPRTVGADRIVNAVAAKELFGAPAIVVDFGTATTFDVVGKSGAYEGGVISPGLIISANALSERAAMLPRIELKRPERLIGKNTHDSMLSGIMFGYAALVDGVINRLKKELGDKDIKIIATGGLANLVSEQLTQKYQIVPDLTLRGLQLIARLNL